MLSAFLLSFHFNAWKYALVNTSLADILYVAIHMEPRIKPQPRYLFAFVMRCSKSHFFFYFANCSTMNVRCLVFVGPCRLHPWSSVGEVRSVSSRIRLLYFWASRCSKLLMFAIFWRFNYDWVWHCHWRSVVVFFSSMGFVFKVMRQIKKKH